MPRCSLTSEQVREYYLSGGPEAHESTGIIFVETQVWPGVGTRRGRGGRGRQGQGGRRVSESRCVPVSPQRVWRLQETEMWAELCPSAKGAILLYNRVQGSPA